MREILCFVFRTGNGVSVNVTGEIHLNDNSSFECSQGDSLDSLPDPNLVRYQCPELANRPSVLIVPYKKYIESIFLAGGFLEGQGRNSPPLNLPNIQ